MKDQECIDFLQWALPQLHMRWKGFRKVRKQVCKRIKKRIRELELETVEDYRDYIKTHPEEWKVLDKFCRITISRFYRNYKIFDKIGLELMPVLFNKKDTIRCWSAGCASGEEPYSLSLTFFNLVKTLSPLKEIEIIATDANPVMLNRARKGCYSASTIKELPDNWKRNCFERKEGEFCLESQFKKPVTFSEQDIRYEKPAGKFDLILCRNLVATYFEHELQTKVFRDISDRLNPGGYLLLGKNEKADALPPDIKIQDRHERVFYKSRDSTAKTL
jgi:chemotaxis protein methyltransferase CheR